MYPVHIILTVWLCVVFFRQRTFENVRLSSEVGRDKNGRVYYVCDFRIPSLRYTRRKYGCLLLRRRQNFTKGHVKQEKPQGRRLEVCAEGKCMLIELCVVV